MIKKIVIVFIFFIVLLTPNTVFAEYVLPYPSYMPGNKLYKVTRVLDKLKNYWHWGSIAQVKYHMALGDKYIVEAKTLFEYKQYLLGLDALKRSDKEIAVIPLYVRRFQQEGKPIDQFIEIIKQEMFTHTLLLENIKSSLPIRFEWRDEKKEPILLPIHEYINESIAIRAQIKSIY